MVYEVDTQKITAPRFHINGLRCKHSYIHQENTVSIFGISFYSYGLYPFINQPVKEFQNKITDLFDFAPGMANGLYQAVEAAEHKTALDISADIEQALLKELSVNKKITDKAQLILEFMTAANPSTVKSFCDNHSLNIKTFERMVLSCTGFTPKALQNIKRFQIAGNQLSHEPEIGLTDIAFDNQFTDQAHFTKDFKRFSGAAPRTFISEKISVKENAKYIYR